MATRTTAARAGLGATALLGVGALAFSGSAYAASCNSTSVKGLSVTRAVGKAAAAALHQPTGPLAFTGAAGVAGALLIGLALLAAGGAVVVLGRRGDRRWNGRWRGPAWFLVVLCGLGVAALIGSHAASAAPSVDAATCATTPVKQPTLQIPVPVAVVGATGVTMPTGDTAPTGGAVGGGTVGGGAPGTGTAPAGTTTPPPALPDAGMPLLLVVGGMAAGASALVLRSRRRA